jgi:enamine deaminase RidA (YjgF/YER057c/UK114 family)
MVEKIAMNARDRKLQDLGFPLDRIAKTAAMYEPLVLDGTTAYAAGAIPFDGDTLAYKGKVPSVISVEQAQKAAALCAANILRNVIARFGSLDRIERVLRVGGFVNSDVNFTEPHLVINGASQLLIDVLGDAGRHARTAMGAVLPLDAAVEIEMVLKIKP